MKTTREEIINTALSLFARRGFDAVSTSMIAGELGITKGALYRHFENKQEIFDSIFEKMVRLDEERAREDHVPAVLADDSDTDLYRLCAFTCNQFDFWTRNPFASDFRRMVTIEQFKNDISRKLYQDVIGEGPVKYTQELLQKMLDSGKLREEVKDTGTFVPAAELFAVLKLMIELADGGMDPDFLRDQLKRMTEDFYKRWKKQEK